MKVLTTPMPVFSHSNRNCLLARRRMQPLPAMITGRLALAQQVERAIDDLVVRDRATESSYRERLAVGLELREILRQLDQHGARFLGPRDTDRLTHHLRNVVGMANARRPLRNGLEHADDVHYLMRLLVQAPRRPLPGEHQHGRMIHVGIGHAGDQIGCAGPERAETAGRISGEPPIGLGHECRALFVTRQDETNLGRSLQRHHEVGILLTGNAKDVLHPLFLETLDE